MLFLSSAVPKRIAAIFVLLGALAQLPWAQTTMNYQTRVATGNGNVRWSNCAFGPDNRLYVVFGES